LLVGLKLTINTDVLTMLATLELLVGVLVLLTALLLLLLSILTPSCGDGFTSFLQKPRLISGLFFA